MRPVYFHHIHKVGGRSLIYLFLSQSGDAYPLWCKVCAGESITTRADKEYVGWSQDITEDTYFGWSHGIAEDLVLPANTFQITMFRNPIDRLVSYYRMLLYDMRIKKPDLADKHAWAMDGLSAFAFSRCPANMVKRQLYTFSRGMRVNDAVRRVRELDKFFLLSEYDCATRELCDQLGMTYKQFHVTGRERVDYDVVRTEVETQIADELKECRLDLLELLQPEYEMLHLLGYTQFAKYAKVAEEVSDEKSYNYGVHYPREFCRDAWY